MQYVGFHENRVVRGSDDIGYYGISVAILMRLLLNCELDVLSDDGVYDRTRLDSLSPTKNLRI